MGARIELKGNLGGDPVFGLTKDKKPWINFSVYQPHWVKNPDAVPNGPDQYIDKGGFWLQVSWFHAKAEAAERLLKKGTAVLVSGDLHVDTWTDKNTGELKAGYKVTANEVTLDLRGIAAVSYRQRGQDGPQPQPNIGNKAQAAGDGAAHSTASSTRASASADDAGNGQGGWDDAVPPADGFASPVGMTTQPPASTATPPARAAQPPVQNGQVTPQGDSHDDDCPF